MKFSLSTMNKEHRIALGYKFREYEGLNTDIGPKAAAAAIFFELCRDIGPEDHEIIMEVLHDRYSKDGMAYFHTPMNYVRWYESQKHLQFLKELGT